MKRNPRIAGWLLALALLVAGSWGTTAASRAAVAVTTDAAEETTSPDATNHEEDVRSERSERSERRQEVVSVMGDARVAEDQVADEVVVVRGDARIDGEVKGDVVVVFGNLKLNGKVRGDVVVVMGSADIQGSVGGDTAFILSRGALGPKAVVKRQLLAVGVAPVIDAGARVSRTPEIVSLGPVVRYLDGFKDYLFEGVFLLRPFPPRLGWVWVAAAVFLAFHLFLAGVFSRATQACMTTLVAQPARSFLVGLLVCVLVGPVSVLLSFTVVATPLIWLAYMALCVFGRVAVYGAAGAGVLRRRGEVDAPHPVAAVLLGSVLFYVSYMVPVLGFLVYWVVLPWGVGAALIRVFESLRRERGTSWSGGGVGTQAGGGNARSAAVALAGGLPGPATRAVVEEPVAAPAGVATASTEPPPVTASGTEPGTGPGRAIPPVVPLAGVELAALPRVGLWPRLAANLIDLLLIGFVNLMTFQSARSFWFLLAAYHVGMWVWKGTTLGGSVMSLRLARLDGRAVDWETAAYRLLGSVVSLLPLGLGFVWVAWDDECQSWHDRIAGTTVVRTSRRSSLV